MNIKRSLSYNDLSIFNHEFPLQRTQSHKNIRFAKTIRNVCVFKSNDSPSRIASSRKYSITEREWIMESNFKEFIGFFGNQVSLESLEIQHNQLIGNILVKNISFMKSVILWYTLDDWKSKQELKCNFKESVSMSSGSFVGIDRFVFSLNLDDQVSSGKLCFCCKYTVNNLEFWDNNHGRNYQVGFNIVLRGKVELRRGVSDIDNDFDYPSPELMTCLDFYLGSKQ